MLAFGLNSCRLLEYRSSIEHAEKALGAACKDYYKSAKRLTRLRSKAKDENSEALDTISEQLDEIKSIRPQTGSLFVRLWLGHVNVKEHTKGDKLKLRNEYDKFKDKTNMVFLMLAVLGLATNHYLAYKWSYTHWIFNVTHIWLLYYYVSLALRENILKVNGSNIRDWWIIHHYLSALLSIVFITWPPTDTYRMFSDQFMYYFLYQAVVQFLQAGYQKRRHYPRRAMGKVSKRPVAGFPVLNACCQATAMDVSSSETLTEIPSEFYVLVVIVLLAQAFQVRMNTGLLSTHPKWHPTMLCACYRTTPAAGTAPTQCLCHYIMRI